MKKLTKLTMPSAIEAHFKSRYVNDWKFPEQTYDDLSPLFIRFITRTVGSASGAKALSEYETFYRSLSKRVLGNNYRRKKKYQPLAYAFSDFEGSRGGYVQAEEVPHVHSVMLIHPDHILAAEPMLAAHSMYGHIREFDPQKASFTRLASYCMKGTVGTRGFYASRGDLWDVYPG